MKILNVLDTELYSNLFSVILGIELFTGTSTIEKLKIENLGLFIYHDYYLLIMWLLRFQLPEELVHTRQLLCTKGGGQLHQREMWEQIGDHTSLCFTALVV